MKIKLSHHCALAFTLFSIATAANATGARKVAPAAQASMLPSFDLTPKRDLVRFVPCDNKAACYRALQESDIETSQNLTSPDSVTLVTEFVESPQRGMRVYVKK